MSESTETPKKVKHLKVCKDCGGDGHVPDLSRPRGTWYESKSCPPCEGKGFTGL